MDYMIIVAGGKGVRMGADVPKQFLLLDGKPILAHTLERMRQYSAELGIIVVLPHSQQDLWKNMCRKYGISVEHTVVDGGDTRFQSAKNGLAAIPDDVIGVVGIHDAVRPFVSNEVIGRTFEMARKYGAAIPVMPVTDTLRLVEADGAGHNVWRANYRIVQTPQAFDIKTVKRAFDVEYDEAFTDDASVVEAAGVSVAMVDGNRENIKLTTPYDLALAEAMTRLS